MPRLPPPAAPACLLLLLIFLSAPTRPADAGPLKKEFLYPDFTASSYDHIDNNGGAFLESTNGAFLAALHNPAKQQASFYLAVLHAPTGTPVWSANRDAPTGSSGRVQLTARGLAVTDADGATVLWSVTPRATVAALRLRDDGNLQLLDARNATLWQSFDAATDSLLPGQPLRAGSYLTSARSPNDFGQGDYRLAVAASDVALTWLGSTYWRLSNDGRSFKDRKVAAASMSFNASGLFVLAADGALVFRVVLPTAEFRVLKLGNDGRLSIRSYALLNSTAPVVGDFVAPGSDCDLPLLCSSLGLCAQAGNSSSCTCPPLFAAPVTDSGGYTCTPGDGSLLASPASCGSNGSASTSVKYLPLAAKIAYFATTFDAPTTTGVNSTACRARCTANCTCLGYYHDNSSMSCYVLGGRQLGSLHWSTRATGALGYIKAFNSATRDSKDKGNSSSVKRSLPIILPSVAVFLLIAMVAWYLFRRRWKASKNGKKVKSKNSPRNQLNHLPHQNQRSRETSHNEDPDDDGDIVIPGMPARFSYAEIASMTANFETKIGSGGFGSVYRGQLPGSEELVAVKKLEAVGVQAKREFCTEIAVIGSIRHINLVRLRGFCAEGSRRLLVYEYMDRGSLDRSLFGGVGPALEWGERMEVAVGAARGLAYLHTGCDQKIVHCDVKPENILLAHGGQVKVSDFGLAKLMSSEHSAIFTTMRGTRGYLAPEWLSNAAISDRADVYSFGMVLLELVRGRKNRGEQEQGGAVVGDGSGEHSAFPSLSGYSSAMTSSTASVGGAGAGGDDYFPMVALELHEQGRYLDLVDPRVEGRVSEDEAARVVRLALCCLHQDPAQRPSMDAVVRVLEGSAPPPEPHVGALGFLRLYGRGHAMPMPAAHATSGSAGWSAASTTAGSSSTIH